MNYEYEKYVTTPDGVKDMILKYGVAIIPSVLDENETEQMIKGGWDYLEKLTSKFKVPINRNDQKTWSTFYKLFLKHSMLMQHMSVGHAQHSWDVRQNPKIVNIWSKIWGTKPEDLLCSFDGISIHLPPEVTKRGFYKDTKWLHTDQSYTRNDFECIQSWVTAYPVNEGDATLTFLEGSNNFHKDFAIKFNKTDKSDWYMLASDEESDFYTKEKGCARKSIKCPAGSVVFWDSRTIHQGQEAIKGRKEPNLRNIVYVCMQPRSLSNEKLLAKKQLAFNNLRTTSHYPIKTKMFPKLPRTYGAELEPITLVDPPNLTELGKRLAGF